MANPRAVDEVFVVCQVFHPDPQSTSQLLSDVVAGLAERGLRITVISGYPGMDAGERLPRDERWRGVRILRGGMRAAFKRSTWRRLLAYATYCFFVIGSLLRLKRGSRIFVVTNPPFAPVLVGAACKLKGHSYIVMLQDVYPEGLVAVGRISRGGLIDRAWTLANRLAFAAAHEVWVLGRDMAAMIARNYGLASGRVRYVPHWSVVNIAHRRTAETTTLWRRLSLKEKFVVQYSGNMGLWHDMDTIIEAAALLEKDDTVHFLLIGSGIKRARAEETARQTGLRNVTWLPYQKREDLADSLACCHAALISQMEGLEGVAVPCKLYGILASGRAVIAQAPAGAEVAQVVKEEQCGLVVPPGNAAKLAEAIAALAADRQLADLFGQRAFEAYRRSYTLERGTDAFASGWSAWRNVGSPESTSTVAT